MMASVCGSGGDETKHFLALKWKRRRLPPSYAGRGGAIGGGGRDLESKHAAHTHTPELVTLSGGGNTHHGGAAGGGGGGAHSTAGHRVKCWSLTHT